MGFRWRKTEDNRKILVEKHDIRYKRIVYLNKLREYRREGRPIFFADETYIHSTHVKSSGWTDKSVNGFKKNISKGCRLIIVHAGNEKGEVKDALLVFKSGQKTGDYHNDMNAENYEKWLKSQLIPNLPPNSVLVVDNASYHNRKLNPTPNSNSRKAVLLEWLRDKNIPCHEKMFNSQLYELVKMNKPRYEEYYFDKLMEDNGHKILRLPPYHPELNAIELIWAKIKNDVAACNVTNDIKKVKEMVFQKFSELETQCWEQCCSHVLKVEDTYYEADRAIDMQLERFIITNDSDDSDEDSGLSEEEREDADEMDGIEPLE